MSTDVKSAEDTGVKKLVLPPQLRFYRTVRNERPDFVQPITRALSTDGFYPEYSLRYQSGGRSGDLGKEVAEYTFFVSGDTNGSWDGRYAGIYQVTISANGYAKHISVVLQPYEGKPIGQPVTAKLDELDFVGKHHVLDQAEEVGSRSFITWLEKLAWLNEDRFTKPFRRE